MTPSWEAYPHPRLHRRADGDRVHLRRLAHGEQSTRLRRSCEPVTSVVGMGLTAAAAQRGAHVLGVGAFWTHLTIVLAFLNFLPLGKALPRHHRPAQRLLPALHRRAPAAKLRDAQPREGRVRHQDGQGPHLEAGLDLYTCTECGRCQTHCPTYITGKPLTHKGVNQDLKHWLWDHEQLRGEGQRPKTAEGARCRTRRQRRSSRRRSGPAPRCGWCEQACPVFIENVPRLIDMRRYQVQVEGGLPAGAPARLRRHGAPGQPLGHRPGQARRVGGAT